MNEKENLHTRPKLQGVKTQLTGLYDGSWHGVLLDEAYKHPAKFSYNLAAWIYGHAINNGWVKAGDTCIDPFGGVACGAFFAMKHGLHWKGVELESRFVDLGGKNISAWQRRFGALPNYGSAVLLQGDSRRLREVLKGEAQLVASSPPYSESEIGCRTPTGADPEKRKTMRANGEWCDYGQSPGQLGSMREGQAPAIAVSSPPYIDQVERPSGIDPEKVKRPGGPHSNTFQQNYGTTLGQLGSLREGKAPAIAVSSPPYESADLGGGGGILKRDPKMRKSHGMLVENVNYGTENGQLGNQTGDTFWSAAADIVREVYAILKPGGHAIWVCGDFVRKGKRVPFCDQWQALCIQAGFAPVCRHIAWKKSHNGTQRLLDGSDHELTKTKVSFFRRLHARKHPECAVENEEIVCVRKPL